MRLRLRELNPPHRTGTVIGQSHETYHVWWDGQKYETLDFGRINKDMVDEEYDPLSCVWPDRCL